MRRAALFLTALLVSALPAGCVEDRAPARVAAAPPAARPGPAPQVSITAAPAESAAPSAAESAAPAAAAQVDLRPRIGSTRWLTYIWATPDRPKDSLPIGSIRYGTTVPLKSKDPVPGTACATKWYAVEPVGYVCADETTTFDFDAPYWKALASVAPGPGPLPYRYVFSTGSPMYTRIPTKDEQFAAERDLSKTRVFKSLGKWSYGHERLVDTDPVTSVIKATDEIPAYFRDHGSIPGSPWNPKAKPNIRFVPNGSGISYAKAFEAEGRVWLLTPELFLVPADRVFPYKTDSFKGTKLEGDMQLPIVWVRGAPVKKLRREADGSFKETGESWAGKMPVPITDNEVVAGKARYHETKEAGIWIAESNDVSLVKLAPKLPATVGPDEKWLDAHLLPGTMVAYVGMKPVWTTLWSGGKGGVPVPGGDHKENATTELGTFSFQWKDAVATMSPDKGAVTVFWFADVPHIQYVHAPLAMHVSFWHADFGFLRSAECLNVSPLDGEWLFNWTLPALPESWGAVRPSKLTGPSTKIVIRAN